MTGQTYRLLQRLYFGHLAFVQYAKYITWSFLCLLETVDESLQNRPLRTSTSGRSLLFTPSLPLRLDSTVQIAALDAIRNVKSTRATRLSTSSDPMVRDLSQVCCPL